MKKFKIISSLMFLLGLIALIAGCSQNVLAADESYVTIDINPSIELIISKGEKVVYANALNEDGEILLAEINLVGMDLDEAMDLIIETSIALGFIDPNSEEVIVEVQTICLSDQIKERIQNRVKEHINQSFENRGIMGRGENKTYQADIILEAEGLGVTPGFLVLAKAAVFANNELSLEEALEMEVHELQALIKASHREMKQVAQGLRDTFLAEKQIIIEAFQLAKAELEAQIESAEDATLLEAELALLIEDFKADMSVIREAYLTESIQLRLEYRLEFQARKQLHQEEMKDFMEAMAQRRETLREQIKEFQGKRP